MKSFKGKRVLVTGACGTVGQELIQQLLGDVRIAPDEIIGLDNNESELFFQAQKYSGDNRIEFFISDIRSREELSRKMEGINIVFHTAAYKHVVLCEHSPEEAVQTNIIGLQNIIYAALQNNVDRVIFTSSDKAVNPTNVMGTTKLMGERLITAANINRRGDKPIFVSTRFGNVLGSRGSVIPIFRDQIENGGPITITDTKMTRFIMSIQESVRLVIDTAFLAKGGEVFVTKMPVIKIEDLAHVMRDQLVGEYGYENEDIAIEIIGAKPGEKNYEELMNDEETRRAIELPHYFVVLPAFRGIYQGIEYDYEKIVSCEVTNSYISKNEQVLNRTEIAEFLSKNDLF